mmetsp:Transcript_2496/g.3595  ORF Transcript_2496/g.3595 Transcript_2496/m.3595 type:complete len:696 (-) Transcript_2496:127-2214(-)
MGCSCSTQVDKAVEGEDIVGGVGRTTKQVDPVDVPEERGAMVALEVAASRKTMYRKKQRKFAASGDLNYCENQSHLHMRNLLDEPVGIFYLKEFSQEKKIPEITLLVDAWVKMHKLGTPRDLSLEEVLELCKEEDREKEQQREEEEAKLRSARRMSIGGLRKDKPPDEEKKQNDAEEQDVNDTPPLESGDALEKKVGLNGCYHVDLSDEEVLKNLQEILDIDLVQGSPVYELLDKDLVAKTVSAVKSSVEKNDVDAIRYKDFVELKNFIFLKLINDGHHESFRSHSEYKRYKLKFAKVYNTISHRDFDFMETLGKGSFGRVIRIKKKTTKKQYALKVMSKKKILSGAESADQVTIERHVLVMCDSPSIVKTVFAFQTSRALFLALELLDGGTLDAAMKACDGTLGIEETRFLSAQILLGLEHLHEHGFLYRDLKPVNVMLDSHGNAVLTDMGLCAKFRNSQSKGKQDSCLKKGKSMKKLEPDELKRVGTYGFRAPEVLDCSNHKQGYGPAVDYWALGVTIHYLLYGKLPFSKKIQRKHVLSIKSNANELEAKMQREPLEIKGNCPEDAKGVIESMLILEPEERLGGGDPMDVRKHPFFAPIDFDKLARRELKPVYKPKRRKYPSDEKPRFDGLADAMQQFSQDNVLELFGAENEMQDEYTHVARSQQKLFREWDYIPDKLLQADWKLCKEDRVFP